MDFEKWQMMGGERLTAILCRVDEGYIGCVPEVPGANAQGATLREAFESLGEAVELVRTTTTPQAQGPRSIHIEHQCGDEYLETVTLPNMFRRYESGVVLHGLVLDRLLRVADAMGPEICRIFALRP